MAAVTISEVAKRAGVSMKTVSRVLNAEPYVREELRQRVQEAVRELRYRPNVFARSLAGTRSYMVAFPLGDPLIPYLAAAQMGALTACREAGCHLVTETIDVSSPDLRRALDDLFGSLVVDGVLLTAPYSDDLVMLEALERAGLAYARVAPTAVERGHGPYVVADERAAAFELVSHLLDLGHRRIGFVTGPASHGASEQRLSGFRDAMAARDMPAPAELVVPGAFDFESGQAAAEALLALPQPPTAVFASNDAMALGVLATAHARGLNIPQDLSVAGFDDVAMAAMSWPSLTTVRQPIQEMTAAATRALLAHAAGRGDEQPQARTFHCQIVLRASTGAPGRN